MVRLARAAKIRASCVALRGRQRRRSERLTKRFCAKKRGAPQCVVGGPFRRLRRPNGLGPTAVRVPLIRINARWPLADNNDISPREKEAQ